MKDTKNSSTSSIQFQHQVFWFETRLTWHHHIISFMALGKSCRKREKFLRKIDEIKFQPYFFLEFFLCRYLATVYVYAIFIVLLSDAQHIMLGTFKVHKMLFLLFLHYLAYISYILTIWSKCHSRFSQNVRISD